MDCVFCKIASGEIPSQFVYQDDEIVAVRDIHPVAPTHVLVIPREHIVSVADLSEDLASLVGKMATIAGQLAKKEGVADSGFRLVINNGPDAGQEISHLHMHLIGGRRLGPLG